MLWILKIGLMRHCEFLSSRKLSIAAAGLTLALAFLSGCSFVEDEPPPRPPTFDFGGAEPFVVQAQSIQIIDEFRPSLLPPNVEHEYDPPPAAVAHSWGKKRLAAQGGAGELRFIIRDASLTERDLQTDNGFQTLFGDEPNIELSARLEIMIEYRSPAVETVSRAVVTAKSASFENASLAELDQDYYRLLEEMAIELDKVFTEKFDGKLSQILALP